MASESIAHEAEDSEPIQARGKIVKYLPVDQTLQPNPFAFWLRSQH